jgi:hypothetical protein
VLDHARAELAALPRVRLEGQEALSGDHLIAPSMGPC